MFWSGLVQGLNSKDSALLIQGSRMCFCCGGGCCFKQTPLDDSKAGSPRTIFWNISPNANKIKVSVSRWNRYCCTGIFNNLQNYSQKWILILLTPPSFSIILCSALIDSRLLTFQILHSFSHLKVSLIVINVEDKQCICISKAIKWARLLLWAGLHAVLAYFSLNLSPGEQRC